MAYSEGSTVSGVYLIYCWANSKAYVGSSNSVRPRLNTHRCELRKGTHSNAHLQAAWNLYGEGEFSMGLLHPCPKETKVEIEQHYIDLWVSAGMAFNINKKAESSVGTPCTPERAAWLSQYMSANPPFKGRKHTPEAIKVMSEVHKAWHADPNNLNPFEGKTHSDETKAILAEAARGNKRCMGRAVSPATRAKIGAANSGPKDVTPAFLAAAKKVQSTILSSPEIRARVAQKQIGRARSPDTVARMSNSSRVKHEAKSKGLTGLIETSFIRPSDGVEVFYTLNTK